MTQSTSFTDLTGCRVPIQQAPMGSISTPALAVAVAAAGGVGTITALGIRAGRLDAMLSELTARTDGVLAVNFLTDQIDREAVAVAGHRVPIVDFFWTDPDPSLVGARRLTNQQRRPLSHSFGEPRRSRRPLRPSPS